MFAGARTARLLDEGFLMIPQVWSRGNRQLRPLQPRNQRFFSELAQRSLSPGEFPALTGYEGSLFSPIFPYFFLSLDVEGTGDFFSIADNDEGVRSGLIVPIQGCQSVRLDSRGELRPTTARINRDDGITTASGAIV